MKKKEFYRVGDTDTKKNSPAPEAGECLRNLNPSKNKSSIESGTNSPYQAATGDRRALR